MRTVLIALAVLFLSLPAQAQDSTADCSLKVNFGSYAKGIDTEGYQAVRKIIDSAEEVDTYTDLSWGREGERTICIQTHSMQATDKLYNKLVKYIPHVSDEYWTEVVHEDGRTQKTQWPNAHKVRVPFPY